MPPRHAYWTILIGDSPTAFRAREREELLPTFERLRAKQPDAVLKWFERGRLWASPEEARGPRASARRPAGTPRQGVAARWRAPRSARPFQEGQEARRQRARRPRWARRRPIVHVTSEPVTIAELVRPDGRGSPGPTRARRDRRQASGPIARGGPSRTRPGGDKPWRPKPAGGGQSDRPWRPKPSGDRGDRPWRPKPTGSGEQRPWKPKPPSGAGGHGPGPAGKRPWQPKPARPDQRPGRRSQKAAIGRGGPSPGRPR